IFDAVVAAGGAEDSGAGRIFRAFAGDREAAATVEHEVNLVGTRVRVGLLRLPGLQAVDVEEEPLGLKQVVLLQLLGVEGAEVGQVFDVHGRYIALRMTGPANETAYRAARDAAAVYDSGREVLRVIGEDRVSFLHGMVTNDVNGLQVGAV